MFLCPERCILVFLKVNKRCFSLQSSCSFIKGYEDTLAWKTIWSIFKTMVNRLFLTVLFCIFNLQNGVSLVCLSESNICFKNQIFVFLILCFLWWHIAVGHPIRMELNTFPTKWKRNTIFLYLSIFNGEYLWIHLVQQGRLILKHTGIFTFGVSNAFLRFFFLFSMILFILPICHQNHLSEEQCCPQFLSTRVHCQILTCYSTVTRASVTISGNTVFLYQVGKAQPCALGGLSPPVPLSGIVGCCGQWSGHDLALYLTKASLAECWHCPVSWLLLASGSICSHLQ